MTTYPESSQLSGLASQLGIDMLAPSVGVAVLAADGTICYLNMGWKTLLGVRDADALRIGNNYPLMLRAMLGVEHTYLVRLQETVQAVLDGSQESATIVYPHNRSGQWCWCRLSLHALSISGARYAMLTQRTEPESIREQSVGEPAKPQP